MFDDSEAALDALLSRAVWEAPDEQMVQRLKALVVDEQLSPSPRYSGERGEERAVAELRISPSRATSPSPLGTGQRERMRARRPIPFFVGLAACLLFAIGAAFLLVHRAMKPTTIASKAPVDINSLPGRAPTPMELWMTSPRGQKRLAKLAEQRPRVDPERARLAEFIRTSDTRTLATRLTSESNSSARGAILQSMLTRPDGTDRYLDLVLNPSTRDQALQSLQSLSQAPTQQLLRALDSPQVSRRFAAARALGSLCHGEVLPQMKRMIEQDNHRREAMAVLIECKDSDAAKYVQQIRKQPSLGSELNVVRTEMQKLF
jgi:hypothetical protein